MIWQRNKTIEPCEHFKTVLAKAPSHPNVLKPVGSIHGWEPVCLVDGWVHHFLQLPQRLAHHVDVGDLQEVQLHVGVETLTLIATIFGLQSGE